MAKEMSNAVEGDMSVVMAMQSENLFYIYMDASFSPFHPQHHDDIVCLSIMCV